MFDDCSAGGERAALVAFLLGDAAGRWSDVGTEARQAAVLEDLARFFGPAAAAPLAYADQDWLRENCSGGCYVGLAPPGLLTWAGAALWVPVGRLHLDVADESRSEGPQAASQVAFRGCPRRAL